VHSSGLSPLEQADEKGVTIGAMGLRAGAFAVFATATACLSEPPRPQNQSDGGPPPPAMDWTAITAARVHSCGIRGDGTLWCWGRNDNGQLGTSSSDVEDDVPTRVGSTTWSAVSAGGAHTCAIDTGEGLWCWGDDTYGELGIGSSGASFEPTQVGGSWIAVASGLIHTCAIRTDGSLWCWGDNSYGALGNGSDNNAIVPVEVAGSGAPTTWTAVAAAVEFTCAIAIDQSLWCWGFDVVGSLGDGENGTEETPVPSGSASDRWTQIAAGGYTACGILTDGSMKCWGQGNDGELGNDSTNGSTTPVVVGHGDTWKSITVGSEHACGIDTSDALYCWGANTTGQLAMATTEMLESSPAMVTSPQGTWLAVAGGDAHTCAIDSTNALWCAGLDGGGQLGSAGGGSRTMPTHIGSAMHVALGGDVINGTGDTACSIDGNAQLACWGNNANGAVGDTTLLDRDVPTAISFGEGSVQSVAVSNHVCAIDGADALYCWGYNTEGAIGDGSVTDRSAPVPIAGLWASVATSRHTCAIDAMGSSSCWGLNDVGQTGQLETIPYVVSPAPIEDTFMPIAVGDVHSCGIIAESVVCWGDQTYGELGSSAAAGGPNPVEVAGLPLSADLVAGGLDTCAGMSGTFECWGKNDHGQLGNQTSTDAATPIPFTLPGTWFAIAIGENHACGVTTDNTLQCWGANDYGQLGLGSFTEYHEPRTVGSGSDWASVSVGVDDTCALTTNNDLYCWGRNLEGEVGDGSAWRSTLLQVAAP
jgi:alpha-tubulin suppressor-like RCC1 family protein